MIEEVEITAQIKCEYDILVKILEEKGFKQIDDYILHDYYMINKNINIQEYKPLELLKKCILVRNVDNSTKELLYKYKEYDDNENIIKQGKVKCPIEDINKAINFMEAIEYQKIIEIYDHITVYSDGNLELAIQKVNDKYIFIEYESVDIPASEMIETLKKYNLPIEGDNYFVKKAEIILKETMTQ